MLKDCYARYDANDGRILIGNSRIEKALLVNGSCVRTEKVTDLQNKTEWTGDTALWQRCPVLEAGEQPIVTFETAAQTQQIGIAEHTKAVLTLDGKNGTVWYEWIVFPEIPFVFTQIFARKLGKVSAWEETEETASCTGIENSYTQNEDVDMICSADTLDCIALGSTAFGGRHLEAESIVFYDKTDFHDSLVERHTVPVYQRGRLEQEGNIFRITDYPHGDSLLLIKHSPTPSSALNRQGADLVLEGNRYAQLTGCGVDFSSMPEGRVPYYASAVGAGKTEQIWEELWRYWDAFSQKDPRGSLFVMSNTWGDRSQDMAVCESFLLKELDRAKELGVDIVQIDDGWQSGITANSLRKKGGAWEGYYSDAGDFWEVNEERFPNGLTPVITRAAEYGIEFGLWFGPDSSQDFANAEKDIETLWELYQTYGVCYFKLDGVKIRSKLGEMRFIHILEELTRRSKGEIRFNLDVTAEDRFGYLYCPQYGTLFVENRYTDWGNYYPHNTFKNLWSLAAVIPARRLQMELLNNKRNQEKYTGMPFAPAEYSMDYLFATVLPANPLVWMEVSHLAAEDVELLARVIAVYKQHASELFASRVIPIGECPNGMHFSGYLCLGRDQKSGHLLLFREQTEESAHLFALPKGVTETLDREGLTILYQSAPVELACREQGVWADFAKQRSFVWVKYNL